MIIKSLISRKIELVDKVENFCIGLKSYIRDVKTAKEPTYFSLCNKTKK